MNQKESIYQDHIYLMDHLKTYASPKSKLTTMIKSGNLIKLRRGLFLSGDNKTYSVKTLANKIYGPSYVSFEYALSYYNLIPERAESVTSASFNKNKTRQFHTPLGSFIYKNIKPAVFPYSIVRIEEQGNPFLIASREKALCDTLSKISGIRTLSSLESLLFKNLRLDRDELFSMNAEELTFLAPLYGKKILNLLIQYLEKAAWHA